MFRSPEQTQFHNIVADHIKDPDSPLLIEGATGLGKTRAFLRALFESNKRVAVCLATNALIEQMLNSIDLTWARDLSPTRTFAIFRSRMYFD
jgi:Rad3-related DNA helicase